MIKVGKGIDLGHGLTSYPIKFDYTGKHPWDKLKRRVRNKIKAGGPVPYEEALQWVLDQMDEVMKETELEDL